MAMDEIKLFNEIDQQLAKDLAEVCLALHPGMTERRFEFDPRQYPSLSDVEVIVRRKLAEPLKWLEWENELMPEMV